MIGGEWEIRESDTMQRARLVLKQHASQITGTCLLVRHDTDHDDDEFEAIRSFAITGRINDRFVELSFRHKDNTRLGIGVFVLEVVGDGRRMRGQQTFYSVASERIDSSAVVVQRPMVSSRQGKMLDAHETDDGAAEDQDGDQRSLELGDNIDHPEPQRTTPSQPHNE